MYDAENGGFVIPETATSEDINRLAESVSMGADPSGFTFEDVRSKSFESSQNSNDLDNSDGENAEPAQPQEKQESAEQDNTSQTPPGNIYINNDGNAYFVGTIDASTINGSTINGGDIMGTRMKTIEDMDVGRWLRIGYNGNGYSEGNIQLGSGATIQSANNGDNIELWAMGMVTIGEASRDNMIATQRQINLLQQQINDIKAYVGTGQ